MTNIPIVIPNIDLGNLDMEDAQEKRVLISHAPRHAYSSSALNHIQIPLKSFKTEELKSLVSPHSATLANRRKLKKNLVEMPKRIESCAGLGSFDITPVNVHGKNEEEFYALAQDNPSAHSAGKMNQKMFSYGKSEVENKTRKSQYAPKIDPSNIKFEDLYIEFEILGEGSSAVVKRCMSKLTRKEFAVKILRADDEELVSAYKEEYDLLKKLNHPNIVKAYELFMDSSRGRLHLVMELIEGKHMFDSICDMGVYTEGIASSLFKQLLKAVQYLHANGVVHRDIKPNNIMVANCGHIVKLTDFNVSKRFTLKNSPKYDKLSQFNYKMLTPTGTFAFCAPELLQHHLYSESVDMWSCGTVLYSMLLGCQPFYSERSTAELLKSICSANYNMEGNAWQNISESAKDLISKLLIINPSNRLTPHEALNHPWIKLERLKNHNVLKDSVRRMTELYLHNKHKGDSGRYTHKIGTLDDISLTTSPFDTKIPYNTPMSPEMLSREPKYRSVRIFDIINGVKKCAWNERKDNE